MAGKINPERREPIENTNGYNYPPPNPAQVLQWEVAHAIRIAKVVTKYKDICDDIRLCANTFAVESRLKNMVNDAFDKYFKRGE